MEKKAIIWIDNIVDNSSIKTFNLIDIVKFICAFFVLFIHYLPSDPFYFHFTVCHFLSRVAVPFYFSAAGFLLFRKTGVDNDNRTIITNYIIKIGKLCGLWFAIQFFGGHIQLWYMAGLIIGICIISIMQYKKLSISKMTIIVLILYAVGLLGDSYYRITEYFISSSLTARYIVSFFNSFFSPTRNGFFMGAPFIFLGYLIAKKQFHISKAKAISGFVSSFILFSIEAMFVLHHKMASDYNMYIMLLPLTFFLLYLTTHLHVKDNSIYKKIRIAGMYIFYGHFMTMSFISTIITSISEVFSISIPYHVFFIIGLLFTVLVAFILEYYTVTQKNKILNMLVS